MQKTKAHEAEQPDTRRAQVMSKLKKVAELVARSPSLSDELLERLDCLLITFLEAYDAQRSYEREARWAKFEASQTRNTLKTVHELGLPPRFLGAFLMRKYPSYNVHTGLPDATVPGYHRRYLLAGDLVQYSREDISRLIGHGGASTMKAAEAALEKYGLHLGVAAPHWVDFEKRAEF